SHPRRSGADERAPRRSDLLVFQATVGHECGDDTIWLQSAMCHLPQIARAIEVFEHMSGEKSVDQGASQHALRAPGTGTTDLV
ncbi:MAG: hypothetical protein WBQ19_06610, partial [Terriglobales bacterium]